MFKRNRLKTASMQYCYALKNCECYMYKSTRHEYSDFGAAYEPKNIEGVRKDNYNYFLPPIKDNLKPFSIILPPPNITGTLHLGHALTVTIQDVLMRWHRMHGHRSNWIPGIDHAGIATQVVVEKKLRKEINKSRHDLGREKFEEEIWKWKDEKKKIITSQLHRLAPSMDLTSIPFTMDTAHASAVTRAFITLHESGLVYRANRLVNWSCRLQSAISDIEVERHDVAPGGRLTVPGYDKPVLFGQLVKFGYKLVDSEDEELVVATTRPETIPGDVAVAVHPEDARYAKYVGCRVWHPFRQTAIPVIADHFVDPTFGTGVVKITPAHDPTDFEVSLRHKLPSIDIIAPSGHLTSECIDSRLIGARRFDARALVLDALAQAQLLRGTDEHALSIPTCARSGDVVEHLVKAQWFVSCAEMAQRALEAVRDGRLNIEPAEQFERVWFNWLENIRDWCVSRQLWWGHRIPAYNCTSSSGISCWVTADNADEAKVKGAQQLGVDTNDVTCTQDEDVLDTWFSSALLPFSLNGWPENTNFINNNYPLSLMETGHDILFFWVARMVMLGVQLTGKLPFDTVLLHGIICDAQRRKMSKSVGNVIAPEDIIFGSSLEELQNASKSSYNSGILSKDELSNAIKNQKKMFPEGIHQCGADALRFTLCSHNIKSHFINFDVQECKTNKFFGNKIWQATKFATKWMATIGESLQGPKQPDTVTLHNLTSIDLWILSKLTRMVDVVNESIGKYDFHTATSALKNFMYYEFCDVYLEACKSGLQSHSESTEQAVGHCYALTTCLDTGLRTLAPFMPMLAEHLHRALAANDQWKWMNSLEFPQNLGWRNESLEEEIENVLEVLIGIRRLKKMFSVTGKHKPYVTLSSIPPELLSTFSKHKHLLTDLANCHQITISDDHPSNDNEVVDSTLGGRVRIHLLIPPEVQKILMDIDVAALDKQTVKLAKELDRFRAIINNVGYNIEKAGEEIHQNNLNKIATLEEKLSRIELIKKYSTNQK